MTTIILHGPSQRQYAKTVIDEAPVSAVMTLKPATRSVDQNSKMWAMLTDVAWAQPEGRKWAKETWKAAFMHALGHQCQFAEGLDGSGPFPLGFRTSKLSKSQMADLITVLVEYGDRFGVIWSDPEMNRDMPYRTEPRKSPEYLEAIHNLPCAVCASRGWQQSSPTQAHHVICERFSQVKTPDVMAIPLCDGHHLGMVDKTKIAIHQSKLAWVEAHGPDTGFIARTQNALFRTLETSR